MPATTSGTPLVSDVPAFAIGGSSGGTLDNSQPYASGSGVEYATLGVYGAWSSNDANKAKKHTRSASLPEGSDGNDDLNDTNKNPCKKAREE
jgi:hypothetical protein